MKVNKVKIVWVVGTLSPKRKHDLHWKIIGIYSSKEKAEYEARKVDNYFIESFELDLSYGSGINVLRLQWAGVLKFKMV